MLAIRAHLPAHCQEPKPATVQLEALGDFDASALTSETLTQAPNGSELAFPLETQAVEARGEGGAIRFLGVGRAAAQRDIDFLWLPEESACDLYRPGPSRPYPLATGGEAVGLHSAERVLLVAGGIAAAGDAARALRLDLDTGSASEVPDGMIPGRAFATVTELGPDALLVAGGIDPSEGALESAPPIASAVVYEIESGRFDRSALIALSKPRARHGAVVLDSGDTLLVGGAGPDPLTSLEIVSPTDRAARVVGLTGLARPRIAPVVLRLDDGRVFVGGGVDAAGDVVPDLEWLAADGSQHLRLSSDVRSAPAPGFAAMPGGAVLAVGVCVPGQSSAERPDCIPGRLERQVAWIRADYGVDRLPPLPLSTSDPRLIPAADGAPYLLATTAAGARVLLRFDPWSGAFVAPEHAPELLPVAGTAPIAADPGLFVWLSPFGDALSIRAFRHGTRNRYSRDVAPLLLAGGAHVAPDRAPLPGSGIVYGAFGLELEARADPPRAFVTDTSYADLRLEIELAAPTDAPPRVALGGVVLGDGDCPWPGDATSSTLLVRRGSSDVTLARGSAVSACDLPPGRVTVELRAPAAGVSRVRSLVIRRAVP